MKKTTFYADPEDLAAIRKVAQRRGVPMAEVIREGVRLAAMASRVWNEPLLWPTFDGDGETASAGEVTAAVTEGATRR